MSFLTGLNRCNHEQNRPPRKWVGTLSKFHPGLYPWTRGIGTETAATKYKQNQDPSGCHLQNWGCPGGGLCHVTLALLGRQGTVILPLLGSAAHSAFTGMPRASCPHEVAQGWCEDAVRPCLWRRCLEVRELLGMRSFGYAITILCHKAESCSSPQYQGHMWPSLCSDPCSEEAGQVFLPHHFPPWHQA